MGKFFPWPEWEYSLHPCACSLVQRKGAALMQLVTFPASEAARAVWHCWWLHLCEVYRLKKLLSAAKKERKKGISRVKEKILRTMENSIHLLPAKHRKQQWKNDQLFHLYHTFLQTFLQLLSNNICAEELFFFLSLISHSTHEKGSYNYLKNQYMQSSRELVHIQINNEVMGFTFSFLQFY